MTDHRSFVALRCGGSDPSLVVGSSRLLVPWWRFSQCLGDPYGAIVELRLGLAAIVEVPELLFVAS